jgi:hypothetical protein
MFYSIISSYMFRLQAELYFLKKAMYTIDNTIIDCEISHYILKILQN